MARPRLSRGTLLNIELSSICSRNRYTDEPASVIAELRATAGSQTEVLAQAAGIVAGANYDEYTRTLSDALRTSPPAYVACRGDSSPATKGLTNLRRRTEPVPLPEHDSPDPQKELVRPSRAVLRRRVRG